MSTKSGSKKFNKIIDLKHYKLQKTKVKERLDNKEQFDNLDKEVIKELKRQTKKIIDG